MNSFTDGYWWTIKKMSKSLRNVIDPEEILKRMSWIQFDIIWRLFQQARTQHLARRS